MSDPKRQPTKVDLAELDSILGAGANSSFINLMARDSTSDLTKMEEALGFSNSRIHDLIAKQISEVGGMRDAVSRASMGFSTTPSSAMDEYSRGGYSNESRTAELAYLAKPIENPINRTNKILNDLTDEMGTLAKSLSHSLMEQKKHSVALERYIEDSKSSGRIQTALSAVAIIVAVATAVLSLLPKQQNQTVSTNTNSLSSKAVTSTTTSPVIATPSRASASTAPIRTRPVAGTR